MFTTEEKNFNLTAEEGVRLYSFLEFATRPSMNWQVDLGWTTRLLYNDEGEEDTVTDGLAEARALVEFLDKAFPEEVRDELYNADYGRVREQVAGEGRGARYASCCQVDESELPPSRLTCNDARYGRTG